MAKSFEMGALDSLCEAKRALESAIDEYENAREEGKILSADRGRLYQMNYKLDEAVMAIMDARIIANK